MRRGCYWNNYCATTAGDPPRLPPSLASTEALESWATDARVCCRDSSVPLALDEVWELYIFCQCVAAEGEPLDRA